MNSLNIRSAIEFARQLTSNTLPIDPLTICRELGIDVIEYKSIKNDGYLIYVDGKKYIFVNSLVSNQHRRKFIVSHELGHFLMHRDQIYSCSKIDEVSSSNINSTIQEFEANTFASELLLPKEHLVKKLPTRTMKFCDISKIADFFDVSMTFAAMKCVQNSNTENEILLCYEKQKLKWYTSAKKSVQRDKIPFFCPVDLDVPAEEVDVIGAWDTLFEGSVHQEVFHTYLDRVLVMLSGIHSRIDSECYD